MTKTFPLYLYMDNSFDYFNADDYGKKWRPRLHSFKATETADLLLVRELSIDVELPDNFDPVPGQIAALEAEKAKAGAEYAAKVATINRRLSELQCIEAPAGVDA